jgi:serine/threonine protein kinase
MYYTSLSSRLSAHFFFCSLLFLFYSFLSIPAALPGCPNLVRYYDAWYEDNQGVLFVQMEFLQGGTLSELARKRRLTEVDARRAICDIARALDHMHARGIGHLDVKPDNILACGLAANGMLMGGGRHPQAMPQAAASASASIGDDDTGTSWLSRARADTTDDEGNNNGDAGSSSSSSSSGPDIRDLFGCGSFKLADLGHATLLGDDSMSADEGDRA